MKKKCALIILSEPKAELNQFGMGESCFLAKIKNFSDIQKEFSCIADMPNISKIKENCEVEAVIDFEENAEIISVSEIL